MTRAEQILALAEKHVRITSTMVRAEIGISRQNASIVMGKLVDRGQLKVSDNPGGWLDYELPYVSLSLIPNSVFDVADVMGVTRLPRCHCGAMLSEACPGEWEPGCDLGANARFAQAAGNWINPRAAADGSGEAAPPAEPHLPSAGLADR